MKRLISFSIILVLLLGYLPQSTAIAEITPLGQQLPADGNSDASNLTNECADYNVKVTNSLDSGSGSLRQAIMDVCPGRSITFAESLSGETITLLGHLRINKSLTIVGLGADVLTISGGLVEHYTDGTEGSDVGGVFWLQGEYAPDVQPITVNISGLTIRDGRAREGGAIYNHSRSTLVLSDSVIGPNNQAIESGGGISNKYGTVTLNRCTIWGNSQITQSGYYELPGGGGIVTYNSPASTTLINSTVSGNHADTYGGGILALQSGVINIIHSTVSLNSAGVGIETNSGGGGVINDSGTVNIRNSIVAGNLDVSPGANPDVIGAFNSLSGNLIGDPTGSTGWLPGEKIGTTGDPIHPLLGTLAKNDPGRTLTHALLTGSPAIDSSICLPEVPFDQRGATRPNSGNTCDIGAYEIASPTSLTILPEIIPSGEFGSAYIQHFNVIGTNKAVTWSWVPVGSQLDFSCDFNFPDVGGILCYINPDLLLPVDSYTFTVNVEEVGGTLIGSRTYTFDIYSQLTFSPGTLLIGRLGQAYNQPVTVAGGASPYTLTLLSGDLPEGLAFNEVTDAISGTPTEAGTFSYIVIQAEDSNKVIKTRTYSLTVLPEHLFTLPESPTSYQSVTFTAEPDFDEYNWYVGTELDGACTSTIGWGQTISTTFYGKGQYKICLSVTKWEPYQEFTDDQLLKVTNYPPTIYGLYVDPYRSFPGQPVEAVVGFGDVDGDKTFTCTIDWGDGTPVEAGTFDSDNYECTFSPHAFMDADTYTITATVVDDEGAPGTYDITHEVIYIYAESNDRWLTSNVDPTTITLYGYAALGTITMQFNIASDPANGTLGDPTLLDCKPDHYDPVAECRATLVFTPTEPPLGEDPYVGEDSFTYTVQDSAGHVSAPPTGVDLYLDENQAPVAKSGSATVLSTMPSKFAIYGSDADGNTYHDIIDQLSFHIDGSPLHGTLSFDGDAEDDNWIYDNESGELLGAEWYQLLTYTPNPGNTATSDSFTFFVNDTHQNSTSATFNLTLHTPTTLHVNNNDDNVDEIGCDTSHCSLREAVEDAEIGDTIDFLLPPGDTITLIHGQLLINKNLQITGPGADQLTISAGFMDPDMNPNAGFRVFKFLNDYLPMKDELSGLTIRDGRSSEGGGVYLGQEVSLDMHDCVIGPNNIVSYAGGGISINRSHLTMTNCTVVGNHGTGTLGGAGVFADSSTLTMINSTITGNVTNNYGGGLLAYDESDVTLIHSTVSGNTANQNYIDEPWGGGGGIYIDDSTVNMHNSIVAGNIDLTDPDTEDHAKCPDVYGAFTSLTGNLVGDSTGSSGWLDGLGDMVGSAAAPLDPLLGTFGLNFPGHSPTYPLLPGSIAIDAVFCPAEVTTDQRGITRPQGLACDSGAFELESVWRYQYLPLIRR